MRITSRVLPRSGATNVRPQPLGLARPWDLKRLIGSSRMGSRCQFQTTPTKTARPRQSRQGPRPQLWRLWPLMQHPCQTLSLWISSSMLSKSEEGMRNTPQQLQECSLLWRVKAEYSCQELPARLDWWPRNLLGVRSRKWADRMTTYK